MALRELDWREQFQEHQSGKGQGVHRTPANTTGSNHGAANDVLTCTEQWPGRRLWQANTPSSPSN